MKAIVVADENWGIGKDGKLLAHLPGDLKYFKEKTKGKTLVMGRKTLESLPGCNPLPDRKNIILTSDDCFEKEGCVVCNGMDQFFDESDGFFFFNNPKSETLIANKKEIFDNVIPSSSSHPSSSKSSFKMIPIFVVLFRNPNGLIPPISPALR